MTPEFQIYPEQVPQGTGERELTGQWRWRFIAGNGENTANGSEGYAGEGNVRRAVRMHCRLVLDTCGVLPIGGSVAPLIVVVDK